MSLRMEGITKDKVALTVLMMGTVPNNYSGPLPSWFTISSPFFQEQEAHDGNVKRIYQGLAAGTLLSLAEGFAVSVISDTWLPLYGTAAICLGYGAGYIYAMHNPATEE